MIPLIIQRLAPCNTYHECCGCPIQSYYIGRLPRYHRRTHHIQRKHAILRHPVARIGEFHRSRICSHRQIAGHVIQAYRHRRRSVGIQRAGRIIDIQPGGLIRQRPTDRTASRIRQNQILRGYGKGSARAARRGETRARQNQQQFLIRQGINQILPRRRAPTRAKVIARCRMILVGTADAGVISCGNVMKSQIIIRSCPNLI